MSRLRIVNDTGVGYQTRFCNEAGEDIELEGVVKVEIKLRVKGPVIAVVTCLPEYFDVICDKITVESEDGKSKDIS